MLHTTTGNEQHTQVDNFIYYPFSQLLWTTCGDAEFFLWKQPGSTDQYSSHTPSDAVTNQHTLNREETLGLRQK